MQIPTKSRELVLARQLGHCLRCDANLAKVGGEWAHRRTRRVVDAHTMCPCNGIYLCRTCHVWCHTHPVEAQDLGWVVSRYVEDPSNIPVRLPNGSLILLDHEGAFTEGAA